MSDRTEHLTDEALDALAGQCLRVLQDARHEMVRRIREGEPVSVYTDETVARLRAAIAVADTRGEDVSDAEWSAIVTADTKLLGSPLYAQILAQIEGQ